VKILVGKMYFDFQSLGLCYSA